jgi:hypothetical protein
MTGEEPGAVRLRPDKPLKLAAAAFRRASGLAQHAAW